MKSVMIISRNVGGSEMLTRKDLIWVLDYVEFSGIFICKTTHWRLVNEESYQPVLINGATFYASRLAWLLSTGNAFVYRDEAGDKWLARLPIPGNAFVYRDKAGDKWLALTRPNGRFTNGRFKKLGRFFDDSDVAAVMKGGHYE